MSVSTYCYSAVEAPSGFRHIAKTRKIALSLGVSPVFHKARPGHARVQPVAVQNRELLPPERLNVINRLTVVARLLSSAVHDTRNALQIVTGHAELFAETSADPEKSRDRSRAILTHSDRATQRLHGLVLMAQDAPVAPSRFELGALVDEVIGLRKSSFGRARIRVSLAPADPATPEIWVRASRPDIVRVAANLMLNAEKVVTGRPDAQIVFSVDVVGGRVQLSVRDTGPGVSAEVLPTLFDAFGPGDGPGIGLFVSKWLTERAGGSLTLVSNDGGATFVMELPQD